MKGKQCWVEGVGRRCCGSAWEGYTGRRWLSWDISNQAEPAPPQSPWSPAGAERRCRKGFSRFLASLGVTQVLVEHGELRMSEGLGCGLLLSPSHLHPPPTGVSGEQYPAPDVRGICRRPLLPLCLCKRHLFCQGGSGMKQESPQWTGSRKN